MTWNYDMDKAPKGHTKQTDETHETAAVSMMPNHPDVEKYVSRFLDLSDESAQSVADILMATLIAAELVGVNWDDIHMLVDMGRDNAVLAAGNLIKKAYESGEKL